VRALALMLALVTLLTAPAAFGQSQTREPDLTDLWSEYPLDQRPAGVEWLQTRERDVSTAGPPPRAPQPGGPIALAILYLMLALAAVTAVVTVRRVVHLPRGLVGRRSRERGR
jgi:hypothetical protein